MERLRRLRDDAGFFGPFGPYVVGLVLVGASLALVSAFTAVNGLSHDQGAYAGVLSGAANSAARDVNVQALAGGQVEIDTTKAPTAFTDYLVSEGGLTKTSPGIFQASATSSGQTAGQTPTVSGLSVSPSPSTTGVLAQGWAADVLPLPVLGTMTVRLPESVSVEPQARLADTVP